MKCADNFLWMHFAPVHFRGFLNAGPIAPRARARANGRQSLSSLFFLSLSFFFFFSFFWHTFRNKIFSTLNTRDTQIFKRLLYRNIFIVTFARD